MGLLIIGEDVGHAGVVSYLVRRTLREVAEAGGKDWFYDNLDAHVRWVGLRDYSKELGQWVPGVRFSHRDRAHAAARSFPTAGGRLPVVRGGWGSKREPEAQFWRLVLIWAQEVEFDDEVQAIIIARDTDNDPSRLAGLQQAMSVVPGARPVLVAAPHRDLEGWLTLGYLPQDKGETKRLAEVVSSLDFDPTEHPERLTARPNSAVTDAKRVLNRLIHGKDSKSAIPAKALGPVLERCVPDRGRIDSHGQACGIAAFVESIEAQLAPVFRL